MGFASVVAAIAGTVRAWAAAASRAKAVIDPGRLDDRMSADIGPTRCDRREASRWSFWGDASNRLVEIVEERRAMGPGDGLSVG